MTKDEIYERLATVLHETFELDPSKIRPDARLYEELDIDRIDAVDLIVRMKPLVGKRLQPEAFKSVLSVQDVVDALHRMMNE